jgi:hypothetical protein
VPIRQWEIHTAWLGIKARAVNSAHVKILLRPGIKACLDKKIYRRKLHA